MRRSWLGVLMATLTIVVGGVADATERLDWRWLIVTDGPTADPERQALVQALRLLPRLPARVAVIDAEEAKPDVRLTLLRLDAFITKDSPVVYVVRQSALFHGAIAGSTLHVHALATVLWHEMAHADGADEREARQREEALWKTFIRDRRVDAISALRYLSALSHRPDDQMLASR